MSPRTGRPTTDPKNNWTGFRLSDNDIEKIDYCVSKTGYSKSEVVRYGIDKLYNELLNSRERRIGMRSFKDVNGNNIPFECLNELKLDPQTDIETNEVTAYLVWLEDTAYEVTKKTYQVIEEKKANE